MEIEPITWLGRRSKKTTSGHSSQKLAITARLPASLVRQARDSGNVTNFIMQALMNMQPSAYLRTNYARERTVYVMNQVASLYLASGLTSSIRASAFASMKASVLNTGNGLILSSP